jgi:hypothetical protein
MRRFLLVPVVTTVGLLAWAAPAVAHEEITPSTFPTGKPTFFALSAANEKTVDLTRISVAAPPGVPFGTTTREPSGWTPQKSDTEITWSGGKVAPDNFEQWGFEIEAADQPGALTYKVTMSFADGASQDAEVVVNAVAPGATSLAPATKAAASSDGLAVAALIVALLGGLLAGVALVVGLRRRGASSSTDGQDW